MISRFQDGQRIGGWSSPCSWLAGRLEKVAQDRRGSADLCRHHPLCVVARRHPHHGDIISYTVWLNLRLWFDRCRSGGGGDAGGGGEVEGD